MVVKTVVHVYSCIPLSPQSVFQELATSQYGVPFSTPQPIIFTAWPRIIDPVTCWYTPTTNTDADKTGKHCNTAEREITCSPYEWTAHNTSGSNVRTDDAARKMWNCWLSFSLAHGQRGPQQHPQMSMCDGWSPEVSRWWTVVPAELIKPPVLRTAWTSPPTDIWEVTEW